MLPNFVGVGVQRAGTTWIHRCLREHPQVCVPHVKKEVQFFNRHFDRGLAWYEAQFAVQPSHVAVGEISPNYLAAPEAIPRMAQIVPKAKLFVVLREPVDRAYSAYHLLSDQYRGMTFREACERGTLIKLGLYAEQLQRLFQHYRPDQVRVFLYDDLRAEPAAFLRDLFRYLGVDETVQPQSTDRRYNRIVFPAGQRLLRRMQLAWVIDAVKNSSMGESLKRIHASELEPPRREEDVQFLKQAFRDDIMKLQEIICRDLSAWL
jgi:hypothetical protein